jgi:hypothetical protein
MKTIKDKTGQFRNRTYYEAREIEDICTQELQALDLYPDSPQPIPIDRFIEKKFNVTHSYENLPSGILGYTKFAGSKVEQIIVAKSLDEAANLVADRKISTTLAHEAGHGLLHMDLFKASQSGPSLFGDEDKKPQILCREVTGLEVTDRKHYDGKWWEYQANMAIGALLLPRKLVFKSLEPLSVSVGMWGIRDLEQTKRAEAIILLSEIFEVNPVVARLRLQELYPQPNQKVI